MHRGEGGGSFRRRASRRRVPAVGVRIAMVVVTVLGTVASVALVGAGAATAASKYPKIPPGNITIGLSESLSGPYAPAGLTDDHNIQNAYKLLASGGQMSVDGHKIVLDIKNDQGDVTAGVGVARSFVSEHVAAVLNASANPAASFQQVPVWEKAQVPMLLNNVTSNQFTDAHDYPWLFSVLPSAKETGLMTARWVAKHHLNRIAVLTDGIQANTEAVSNFEAALHKVDARAHVVTSVTIPPASVDVSSAIAKLRDAKPDLVFIQILSTYGPVWDAINSVGWTPTVVTNEGAFFDGYDSLGANGTNTYSTCADGLAQNETLPAKVVTALNSDIKADGNLADQLIFVQVNMDSLLIIRDAIAKYHSVSNAAIQKALESFHDNSFFWDKWVYRYSPKDHFGFTGERMCTMTPLGPYRIPVIAS